MAITVSKTITGRVAQTVEWARDYFNITTQVALLEKRKKALRDGCLKNLKYLHMDYVEGQLFVGNDKTGAILRARRQTYSTITWNLAKFRAMLAKRSLDESRFLKVTVNEKEVEKAIGEGLLEVRDVAKVSKTTSEYRFRVDDVKPEAEEAQDSE